MQFSKIIMDISYLALFVIVFNGMAALLKKGMSSFKIHPPMAHSAMQIEVSSVIMAPVFLLMQALWLIQAPFFVSDKVLLDPYFYLTLLPWLIFWLVSQWKVFPLLLQSINHYLQSRSDSALMKLCQYFIAQLILVIAAILAVVKFQSSYSML